MNVFGLPKVPPRNADFGVVWVPGDPQAFSFVQERSLVRSSGEKKSSHVLSKVYFGEAGSFSIKL